MLRIRKQYWKLHIMRTDPRYPRFSTTTYTNCCNQSHEHENKQIILLHNVLTFLTCDYPLSLWQFPLLDMLLVTSILVSILHSCSNLKSTALSINFHIACFDIISIIYDDFLDIVCAIPNLIFFHRDLVFSPCASLVAHFPTSHRPHENVNYLTFFGTTKRWHSRSQILLHRTW